MTMPWRRARAANASVIGPGTVSASRSGSASGGLLRIEAFERELGEDGEVRPLRGGEVDGGESACDVVSLVRSGVLLDERDFHPEILPRCASESRSARLAPASRPCCPGIGFSTFAASSSSGSASAARPCATSEAPSRLCTWPMRQSPSG